MDPVTMGVLALSVLAGSLGRGKLGRPQGLERMARA